LREVARTALRAARIDHSIPEQQTASGDAPSTCGVGRHVLNADIKLALRVLADGKYSQHELQKLSFGGS
jgi:hypothetical protein